jgi:hypothetical protein
MYYQASLWEDCRINAYLDYDELKRRRLLPMDYKPIPRHLFIDLDRDSFDSYEELEQALQETCANVNREIFMTFGPAVIQSGNGFHVHVPLDLDQAFENMPEFAGFDRPSIKFMRWAEDRLSNGKADQSHNPSFRSCMFRVPGTLNSKCKAAAAAEGKDPLVTIIGYWYSDSAYSFGAPSHKLINDFHAYLVQELIDDKIEKAEKRQKLANYNNGPLKSSNRMEWIDRLLQIGVEDQRKNLLYWVLAPYLITVRGLDYDKAYSILQQWIDKCNEVRAIDDKIGFRYRIRYCLDTAEKQERKPVKFETFRRNYTDAYQRIQGIKQNP